MNRFSTISGTLFGASTLSRARLSVLSESGPWLRIPLIAAVVLLSVALPLGIGVGRLQLILMLTLAASSIPVFVRWPALGIAALIVVSLTVPSPYMPGGINFSVLLLILLIGLWLLSMLLNRHENYLLPSHTVKPLLLLILASCLSFAVGQLPWFVFANSAPIDAQLGGLAIFVLSSGAFLMMAHQIRELRWLELLTWLFLLLGGLFIAGWLIPGLGRFTSVLFLRRTVSNSMFWVWLVALAFSQAVYNRKLRIGWRLALLVLVAATLYVAAILNSGWKSGYIPPLAAVVAIIGARSMRSGIAMSLAGIVLLQVLLPQAISTDLYSYSTRIDAWLIMFEIIKANPILGFGPANYRWITPLFPIRGYYVPFNAHNNYLDIIAQVGLLGLTFFLWFAWRVGQLGWRLRSGTQEGFAQAYVYGAIGGLAGMLVAMTFVDWVLPFVYNVGLGGFPASMMAWLFLGGLVSIEQITRRETGAADQRVIVRN